MRNGSKKTHHRGTEDTEKKMRERACPGKAFAHPPVLFFIFSVPLW
jgi:hypothetical protein